MMVFYILSLLNVTKTNALSQRSCLLSCRQFENAQWRKAQQFKAKRSCDNVEEAKSSPPAKLPKASQHSSYYPAHATAKPTFAELISLVCCFFISRILCDGQAFYHRNPFCNAGQNVHLGLYLDSICLQGRICMGEGLNLQYASVLSGKVFNQN